MKEEEQYGEQPEQPILEGDKPTFEASSEFSLDHAIHRAAEKAQAYYDQQLRKEKIYLEIVRQEVAIGNPHISEYRARLTGPEGGG